MQRMCLLLHVDQPTVLTQESPQNDVTAAIRTKPPQGHSWVLAHACDHCRRYKNKVSIQSPRPTLADVRGQRFGVCTSCKKGQGVLVDSSNLLKSGSPQAQNPLFCVDTSIDGLPPHRLGLVTSLVVHIKGGGATVSIRGYVMLL